MADRLNPDDFPAPREGFVITHVLVVADQDRSREFYRSLLTGNSHHFPQANLGHAAMIMEVRPVGDGG